MSQQPRFRIDQANDLTSVMNRVWQTVQKGLQRGAVEIILGRPADDRTLAQNRKLWPMLNDVSTQVEWYGEYMPPDDWKDVFTAAYRRQRAVPGIDGGFVVLGMRTSKMKKKEFSDLIEIIYAFGAERGVRWSEKALETYEKYREAA